MCRLGLFHSAYGNSFVAMRLYDPASARQRGALRDTVGERAERLVWAFCAVDRQALEEAVLSEGSIRPEGYHLPNIRERGQTIRVSPEDARDMILETVAGACVREAWRAARASEAARPTRVGPHIRR